LLIRRIVAFTEGGGLTLPLCGASGWAYSPT
jgi:hypothetical protein